MQTHRRRQTYKHNKEPMRMRLMSTKTTTKKLSTKKKIHPQDCVKGGGGLRVFGGTRG